MQKGLTLSCKGKGNCKHCNANTTPIESDNAFTSCSIAKNFQNDASPPRGTKALLLCSFQFFFFKHLSPHCPFSLLILFAIITTCFLILLPLINNLIMSAIVSCLSPVLRVRLTRSSQSTLVKKKTKSMSIAPPVNPYNKVICLRCLYHAHVNGVGSYNAIYSDNYENLICCSCCVKAKKLCVC